MSHPPSRPKPSRGVTYLKSIVRKIVPRSMLQARARAAEAREHLKYRDLPIEQVFSEIYRNRDWGQGLGEEAYYSGAGSHDPAIVAPYVMAVRMLLGSLPAPPIVVDVGSGDFNIGRNFVDLARHYYACDIVEDLQQYNRQRYNFPNVEFLCVNAVDQRLPDGDVIFVRQVLQHLSNAHIRQLIDKFQKYNRWIVTEHVPAVPDFLPNADISAGCGFRVLFNSGVVLTAPPFNVTGYSSRVLCEAPQYDGVIRSILFERKAPI